MELFPTNVLLKYRNIATFRNVSQPSLRECRGLLVWKRSFRTTMWDTLFFREAVRHSTASGGGVAVPEFCSNRETGMTPAVIIHKSCLACSAWSGSTHARE